MIPRRHAFLSASQSVNRGRSANRGRAPAHGLWDERPLTAERCYVPCSSTRPLFIHIPRPLFIPETAEVEPLQVFKQWPRNAIKPRSGALAYGSNYLLASSSKNLQAGITSIFRPSFSMDPSSSFVTISKRRTFWSTRASFIKLPTSRGLALSESE